MANFRHSLRIDLLGNLSRRARQFQRDLGRFTGRGRLDFATLGRAAKAADRGLGLVENRYVALATGAAAAGAARYIGGLERRFTRLGIQGNRTAEEMESLKGEIFDVANAPDIRIDPGELISGVEQIIEKTGDLSLARENLRNIALVIQAAGAAGVDAGAMIADLQEKFGLKDKDEFLKVLDTLVRQGKAGAFTLQNMATQGNRVSAAYAATGRSGAMAAREMGAVLQVIRRGTGSAEMSASAFEALLRTLRDAEKVKLLQRQGIQVFDPENPKVMRSVATLMKEIVTAAGGDGRLIGQIFTEEAFRAFTGAIAEFNQTGGLASLDRFLAIQGDGKALAEDSARASRDAAAAWRYLGTAAQRFADSNLAGPIKGLADAINDIDATTLANTLEIMKEIGIAVAGLLVARRAFMAQRGIARMLGGKGLSAGQFATGTAFAVGGLAALKSGAITTVTTAGGAALGGFVGAPAGPAGIVIGAGLGAEIGNEIGRAIADPETSRRARDANSFFGNSGGVGASIEQAVQAAEARRTSAADAGREDRLDIDITLGGNVPNGTEVRTSSSRPDGRIRVNRVDRGAVMQPAGP